ncbi:unnamed protein product [Echinostoma caproni]|uniref:Uncharacterized protein n=1 Tax=Echinostoma caproni TaxID=27848 RepID=A0A183BFX6_9TREM|nr:unnamed protein product [Echinostoma caproni]
MVSHQLVMKRSLPTPTCSKVVVENLRNPASEVDTCEKSDDFPNGKDHEDEEPMDRNILSPSFFTFCQPIPEDARAVAGARQAAASSAIQFIISNTCHTSNYEQGTESTNDVQRLPSGIPVKPTESTKILAPSVCPIKPSVLKKLNVSATSQTELSETEENCCYWSDQTFVPGPEVSVSILNKL